MISIIDSLTGRPCRFCGEPVDSGWCLEEVEPGSYAIICRECWLVTEIDQGK